MIAWLKANSAEALASSNGPGSAGQLLGLKFANATGVTFSFVPYRGGESASMQDLLAGRLPVKFAQPADSLSLVRSGAIRAYAVTAKTRLAAAPELPTTDEAGLPDFHVSVWHGLWLPKGTPAPIVTKLNAAVTTTLADQTVRERLAELAPR
ncbi:hypothetical protein MTX23_35865 (plasmid) [Bradyrhizobium sp. ISRA436]|nr:tripartite tricarboxylate transporter substrate-binding protein [Bradyrhizobium sp. ISRA436]WGS03016.1 hypothetical protein MTX23_35865 [Bradyrhizobium sp. ISRA436]